MPDVLAAANPTASERIHVRWQIAARGLLACYALAGVFGRFPWKADEPYAFGVIWEMLARHRWLIPSIAGQPFVEKPPLVYWLGAAFAKVAAFVPPYEGSRAAILLLVALTAAAIDASARLLHREACASPNAGPVPDARRASQVPTSESVDARTHGLVALLVASGTLGFVEHIHKLTPDLGQLAGAAIATCGLIGTAVACSDDPAAHPARTRGFGLLLGTGTGIAFLSKGLLVPGVMALTALCCALFPAYRRRTARTALAVATLASLPWLLVWPLWLRHASPALFDEWLLDNNIGRFVGFVALGGNHVTLASKFASVLVMGFPPLAVIACNVLRTSSRDAVGRSGWAAKPAHAALALCLAIFLSTLVASASMRDVYVLPALPAVALLGTSALVSARPAPGVLVRGVEFAFAAVACVLLATWLCLVVRGDLSWLPALASLAGHFLPLPFALAVHWGAVVTTIGALVAWQYASRHAPLRSATLAFCCGIAMTWALVASLLLPWVDAARSYRGLLLQVSARIRQVGGCVVTVNLGESEVALLDYVAGAPVTRIFLGHSGVGDPTRPNPAADRCPWMLVLSNRSSGPIIPNAARWTAVWSGARPADRNERFVLYRRRESPR